MRNEIKYPKILFLDCETSPNLGLFWGCGYKVHISPEQIIEERQIICASWKWEHEDRVHNISWGKEKSDKRVLEKLLPVIAQADMVIAHNGKRFDIPWINARLMFHKLPPFPTVKVLDTLRECKSTFYLNSNRLDYVAKYIGREGKISVPYSLWKDIVLHNRNKDLATMVEYCNRDILELEGVYKAIKPYIKNTFNLSSFNERPDMCPKCGSHDLVKNGLAYAQVGIKQRYKCMSCGYRPVGGKSVVANQSSYPR